MKGYRFIDDLTSDVMFEASGKDLREVFSNAAEAMFSVICDIKKVKAGKTIDVEVSGKDGGDLMIKWLQELISLVDTEDMFFSRFEIAEIDENHLKARAHGEEIRPELGDAVVKAVTYYKFSFEKTKNGFLTRVSLDI
jgi:SHS2 domain-containing protein